MTPDVINKSDVEKIFLLTMKNLKETTQSTFQELGKLGNERFDKSYISIIGRNLIGKENKDIIKSYNILIDKVLKAEPIIKKLLDTLPESITTNTITAKNAGILNLISNINTFTLISGDVAIVILSESSEKDFPAKVYQDMKSNLLNASKFIEYLNDVEVHIKNIEKADNEININEDNVAIEAILKSKGKLNFGVVESNLIDVPKAIYTLRTWLVDHELDKYEVLKLKKQYLLKRLLEIQNEIDKNPDDVNLKKAKEVYSKEITKISFKIEKIENV